MGWPWADWLCDIYPYRKNEKEKKKEKERVRDLEQKWKRKEKNKKWERDLEFVWLKYFYVLEISNSVNLTCPICPILVVQSKNNR